MSSDLYNNPQLMSVISNMYERMKKESESNSLHIPIDDTIERIRFYTGIPKSIILTLCNLNSLNTPSIIAEELPLNLLMAIILALLNFYEKKQAPKTIEVYNVIKTSCINAPSTLDGFINVMILLGYETIKTTKESLLIENPKYTFERNLFLNKMKRLRERNAYIYYIDVRIISPQCTFKKPWSTYKIVPNTATFLTDSIFFYHVISINGMNNYLYSNSMSGEDFRKWLVDIVIPSLDPNSVVVMENNMLHGSLLSNPITRYHSKAELMGLLKQNNIPCNTDMSKAQLYTLVEKTACLKSHSSMDQIFRAYGHELVLLPTNYQKLSAAEYLWLHLRTSLSSNPKNTIMKMDLLTLKKTVQSHIDSLAQSQWNSMYEKISKLEEVIFAIDNKVEAALEQNFTFVYDAEDHKSNDLIFM